MQHQSLIKAISKAGFQVNNNENSNLFWVDNLKSDKSISWLKQSDSACAVAKHFGDHTRIFHGTKSIKSLIEFLGVK